MEEIQVGEFVRTKEGEIAKIVDTNMFDKTIYKDGQGAKYYLEDIVKHSFNLIDLIEKNDYVNGYKVRGKTNEKVVVDYYCYSEELAGGQWLTFYKDNINSIVTKEQFTSLEYKVEEG